MAALTKTNFPNLKKVRVLSRPLLRTLEKNDGPEQECLQRWDRWWTQSSRMGVRLEDCTGALLGTLPQVEMEEDDEEDESDDDEETESEDGEGTEEGPPRLRERALSTSWDSFLRNAGSCRRRGRTLTFRRSVVNRYVLAVLSVSYPVKHSHIDASSCPYDSSAFYVYNVILGVLGSSSRSQSEICHFVSGYLLKHWSRQDAGFFKLLMYNPALLYSLTVIPTSYRFYICMRQSCSPLTLTPIVLVVLIHTQSSVGSSFLCYL